MDIKALVAWLTFVLVCVPFGAVAAPGGGAWAGLGLDGIADEDDEEDEEPAPRHGSFKIDVDLGWFFPKDVNSYLDADMSGSMQAGFSAMVMHFGFGVSLELRPAPFLGIRPNVQLYIGPKEFQYVGAYTSTSIYMLGAFAPGIAVDFLLSPLRRAEVYITVGFAYYVASFNADFDATFSGHMPSGEVGAGVNLHFNDTRTVGMALGLIGKYAKVPVRSTTGEPRIPVNSLDFSGVMFRFGPFFAF